VRSYLLQRWVTVYGDADVPVVFITQDEEDWIEVGDYSDAVFWIDVRDVSLPSGATVQLILETAPTKDDSLFQPVAPPLTLGPGVGPIVLKSVAAARSVAPLGRWLRWKLVEAGGGIGAWGATFRVRVACSTTPFFVPTQLAGCQLWLRSDLGVTMSGTNVSVWADQSGFGNDAQYHSGTLTYAPLARGVFASLNPAAGMGKGLMTGTFANGGSITTHTLFCVVTYPSASSCPFAATDAAFDVNSAFQQFYETFTGIDGRSGTGGSFQTAVSTDTSSLGHISVYSTAGDASTVDIFINGISKASVATTSLATAAAYVLFGEDLIPDYPMGDLVYEFVVYNRVLTLAERLLVHRYLGGRYGIAVP
jgi:hypothetical protein